MSDEFNIYDFREEQDHPLIRNFRGSSVYESSGPIRPRKDFKCDSCENTIPRGTDAKFVIKAYGDDGDWPSTNVCGSCMDDPKIKLIFDRIMNGEFDER